MKRFAHCLVFALSYAFVAANASAFVLGAESASKPSTNDLERLRMIAQERNVDLSPVFKLVQNNAASADSVASALLDHLNARARKAVWEAEFDAATLLNDLTSVVDVLLMRMQRLERLAKVNAVSESELDDANISLAAAKVSLELARIVSLRRRQLDRAQSLQANRVTTAADVGRAQLRLEHEVAKLRLCLSEELN